jgi:hypothetical protein
VRAPALGLAAFVSCGLLLPATGSAQQRPNAPPAATQAVYLRVRVIHADEAKGGIDKECADVPKTLGPMQFGTLRLIREKRLKLVFGQEGRVVLPEGREVKMLPVSILHRQLYMHLEMPGSMNGQLRVRPGKPIVLGGPAHEGGHLIVHIEPEF